MAKPSTDSEEESSNCRTNNASTEMDHGAVLADKKFMKVLLRELKLFEVCVRIFE